LFFSTLSLWPTSHDFALIPKQRGYLAQYHYPDTSVGSLISIEWRYEIITVDYAESVVVEHPRLYQRIDREKKRLDSASVLANDPELAERLRRDFLAREGNIRIDAPKDWSDCSDWQRETLFEIVRNGFAGKAVKSHAHLRAFGLVYRIVWLICVVGLLSLLIGSLVLKHRVTIRRLVVSALRCPRCQYDARSSSALICPECGLDLAHERKLLDVVHAEGSRGLKRFMAMEREGAK